MKTESKSLTQPLLGKEKVLAQQLNDFLAPLMRSDIQKLKNSRLSKLNKISDNKRLLAKTAVIGTHGAGKTTLIRILTGQQRQTEGTALLLGQDTRKL